MGVKKTVKVEGEEVEDTKVSQKARDEREAAVVKKNSEMVKMQTAPTFEGRKGVIKSEDGPIVVLLGSGEYATTPLQEVPDWYLAHLMADGSGVEIKWRQLTQAQQDAVKAERDRRSARVPPGQVPPAPLISDLDTLQEIRARVAGGIPVAHGLQAPTVAAIDSEAEGTGTGDGSDVLGNRKPLPDETKLMKAKKSKAAKLNTERKK